MIEMIRIRVLSTGRFLAAFLLGAAICCHCLFAAQTKLSPRNETESKAASNSDDPKREEKKNPLESGTGTKKSALISSGSDSKQSTQTSSGKVLEVVRTIPHTGYSEGLDYHEGYLWHALPKAILKIDPKDGEIVGRYLPATSYSESIKWVQGMLLNLSFSDNGIYGGKLKGDQLSFERKGSTPEKTGWGIERVENEIVVTGDHSPKLYFLDPTQFQVKRTIQVPIKDLEDLAWDGVGLWTSSFTSHEGKIFRVSPESGSITDLYSLPDPSECPIIDGIAYDGKGLWVTGKNCVSIYWVKIPLKHKPSSANSRRN